MTNLIQVLKKTNEEYVESRKKLNEIEEIPPKSEVSKCCKSCKERVMGDMVSDGKGIVFCTKFNTFRRDIEVCSEHKRISSVNIEGDPDAIEKVRELQKNGYL